jgi:type II secretion system protein C
MTFKLLPFLLLLSASAYAGDKDPSRIIARNLFCSGCTFAPQGDGPAPTRVRLELVSTMVCPSDPDSSVAVVRDLGGDGEPRMLGVGRRVWPGGPRIVRVVNGRVYLRNGARLEYADLAAPERTDAPVRVLDHRLIDQVLRDRDALTGAAQLRPVRRDDGLAGFEISRIRAGSWADQLGLHTGDVLTGINGLPLATVDDALVAYTRLRAARRLALEVNRRGASLTVDYVVE